MSRTVKYIILSGVRDGMIKLDLVPIIFPELLSHKMVARLYPDAKVESAGFCRPADMAVNPRADGSVKEIDNEGTIHTVRWICWGRSVGLNVESNPERDQMILDKNLR